MSQLFNSEMSLYEKWLCSATKHAPETLNKTMLIAESVCIFFTSNLQCQTNPEIFWHSLGCIQLFCSIHLHIVASSKKIIL